MVISKNKKLLLISAVIIACVIGIIFWFIESKTYTASEVFRGNFSAKGGVLEIIHLKEREQISDEIQTEVSLSKEQQYELIRLLEQAEYKKRKYFEFGYSQYLLSLKSPSVHMLFYDAITASIKLSDGDETYQIKDDGAFKEAFNKAVK